MKLALVLPFLLAVNLRAEQRPEPPSRTLVDAKLTLTSDRTTYYVGEPVRLTMATHNEGKDRVYGYFGLGIPETEIWYRMEGAAAFTRLGPKPPAASRGLEFSSIRLPLVLEPGQSEQSDLMVSQDPPLDGKILLDQPGTMEFKAVCRPHLPGESMTLETNLLSVRVERPPSNLEDVLADYLRSKLAAFVWAEVALVPHDSTVLKRATDFIDRHPNGPYSDSVRGALMNSLGFRIRRNSATDEERQTYERLKGESVPQR